MLRKNEGFHFTNLWRGNTRICKAVVAEVSNGSATVRLYSPSGFANVGPIVQCILEIDACQSHDEARKQIIDQVYKMTWIE